MEIEYVEYSVSVWQASEQQGNALLSHVEFSPAHTAAFVDQKKVLLFGYRGKLEVWYHRQLESDRPREPRVCLGKASRPLQLVRLNHKFKISVQEGHGVEFGRHPPARGASVMGNILLQEDAVLVRWTVNGQYLPAHLDFDCDPEPDASKVACGILELLRGRAVALGQCEREQQLNFVAEVVIVH